MYISLGILFASCLFVYSAMFLLMELSGGHFIDIKIGYLFTYGLYKALSTCHTEHMYSKRSSNPRLQMRPTIQGSIAYLNNCWYGKAFDLRVEKKFKKVGFLKKEIS